MWPFKKKEIKNKNFEEKINPNQEITNLIKFHISENIKNSNINRDYLKIYSESLIELNNNYLKNNKPLTKNDVNQIFKELLNEINLTLKNIKNIKLDSNAIININKNNTKTLDKLVKTRNELIKSIILEIGEFYKTIGINANPTDNNFENTIRINKKYSKEYKLIFDKAKELKINYFNELNHYEIYDEVLNSLFEIINSFENFIELDQNLANLKFNKNLGEENRNIILKNINNILNNFENKFLLMKKNIEIRKI